MATTQIKVMEKHNPKLDHNITLAGLLITDADKAVKKLEREKKGLLKGLYVFKKKIPTGEVYICNGAEFPNSDAVDLLLYLIIRLEDNNWERKLTFNSIRQVLREVFDTGASKFWIEKLERLLIVWKNHSFYFPDSFIWKGKLTKAYFGVIENFLIEPQGRGRPAKVEIIFDDKFLEICKNTNWYRRPSWTEIKKLRKEIAKRLYILALEYKPSEKSQEWRIYINSNLKDWYRNTLNSLADPKHLRPSIIKKRLERAMEEINEKTNFRMELQQTEEGNYCITVREVAPAGAEVLEIPFDRLNDDEKALLIAYLEAVAEEKKIQNIWGFLRSMTNRQIKTWLKKAKKYFESEIQKKKESKFIEKPRLIEILKEWAKERFKGREGLCRVYFKDKHILKALENNKKVVFVCCDRILAQLLNKEIDDRLKKMLNKEVQFIGKEEEALL